MFKIYSVYDSKAQLFGLPFFLPNDDVASREFVRLSGDVNSLVSQFPDDFKLFCLGVFSPEEGKIVYNSYVVGSAPVFSDE